MLKKIPLAFVWCIGSSVFFSCQGSSESFSVSPSDPGDSSVPTQGWGIPVNEIISGGVPKDGIPSLFDPIKIQGESADYLGDDDLVVGLVVGDQAIAYPHTILDWHEVVNETIAGKSFTLSFCPLTGSAIAFDGRVEDRTLKFGVSGLLFRNNLILFDRTTDSHWPQMRLQCDEGRLRGTKQTVIPSIETAWGAWKKLHPNTVILSTSTGFNRPYDRPGTAYPDYDLLNSRPFYQLGALDERLPAKQRVHGILIGQAPNNYKSKVYQIKPNQEPRLINDSFGNQDILVIDVGRENFVVSYYRVVNNTALFFEIENTDASFPFTFKDQETNSTWNVLGEAIDGPLAGTKLERALSFNAYWFAWAAFYSISEIYDPSS